MSDISFMVGKDAVKKQRLGRNKLGGTVVLLWVSYQQPRATQPRRYTPHWPFESSLQLIILW
jgi:hypothetical protein